MGEVQLFVEKYHPDNMLENRAVHIFNDYAMMHFRIILLRKRRQLTLDKFLENIGRLARMSVLDTEVDGSNPESSMLLP